MKILSRLFGDQMMMIQYNTLYFHDMISHMISIKKAGQFSRWIFFKTYFTFIECSENAYLNPYGFCECMPGFAGNGILCGEDEVYISMRLLFFRIFYIRTKMAFHLHSQNVHTNIAKRIIVPERQTQVFFEVVSFHQFNFLVLLIHLLPLK